MTQKQIIPKTKTDKKSTAFFATGKRKTSIARVKLLPGEGVMTINKKPMADFLGGRQKLHGTVNQAFDVTGTVGKFDAQINVRGGGVTGQAEAIRHGVAKALLAMNVDLRKPLKVNGFLTRDAREKERRKVGRRKARRSPQFSKR